MRITFPSDTKDVIDEIRETIGREITVYVTVTGVPCSICTLDPATELSTDPYCLECGGNYYKETLSAWVCSAHVRWLKVDQPLWTPGGIIDRGDCYITIAYSGVALANIKKSHHFVVDDEDLYMKHYILKGVPTLNRIKVTLLESPNTD